jgi:hypothetical protein
MVMSVHRGENKEMYNRKRGGLMPFVLRVLFSAPNNAATEEEIFAVLDANWRKWGCESVTLVEVKNATEGLINRGFVVLYSKGVKLNDEILTEHLVYSDLGSE